ncbi:non-ribosomal peptide synthetase [Streptomyces sp. NRRL F-5123]|uniref:non-ribosomal peptide synthetase n=1 Tax=Streptomyces sp. NRRL F-5123 TaxID=1463856 RepID=UPI0006943AA1|nr:non-ribosomal peptide synthetase [Streptomyces sp. NRRL F-5123]
MCFDGRADQQVKIRGHRIEPGEIEHTLLQHPDVHNAAVTVRDGAHSRPRLVAYTVPAVVPEDPDGLVTRLRTYLSAHLPAPLVPADLVILDALPLTSSGKVDRSALPEPPLLGRAALHPPHTATEKALHTLWTETLGTDRIGITDDFFASGGDSLLAAGLLSRIEELTGLSLPVRAVFADPTVERLAARLDHMRRVQPPDQPAVRLNEDVGVPPASSLQERVWLLEQLNPESALFNMPTALRLRGSLDRHAMRQALALVIARHDILRTSFVEADGRLVQLVADQVALPLVETDLTGKPASEVARCLQEAAACPFDPSSPVLFAATLLRIREDDHILVLVLHHAVGDAWSVRVLFDELSEAYRAVSVGRSPRLPELPAQFAELAAQERQQQGSEERRTHLAYWREVLAGAPAVLELPLDKPRPAAMSHRSGHVPFRLPLEVSRRAAELGRAEGATPFMVLLSAFAVLLARYSGERDLVIGTSPVSRPYHAEHLIGPFVNTLPLRVDIGERLDFRGLVRRVRETTLDALAAMDVPFEQIVEETRAQRSPSVPPLVQITFNLHRDGRTPPRLPGLQADMLTVDSGMSQFDLELALWEDVGGLYGELRHNLDILEESTAERLADSYTRLITAALDDPDRDVLALPLLSPAERRQLLDDWAVGAPSPIGPLVPRLFAEQVGRTPHRTAVVSGREAMSYQELNHRADRLALRLRARGAGPETVVGVCLPRTGDLLVALLGTLKSGAAYLPLDPRHPPARTAGLLSSARAIAVLANGPTIDAVAESSVPVIIPDMDAEAPDEEAGDLQRQVRELPEPHPASLAALIYTSGSTGSPKGVTVTHGGLANYLRWAGTAYSGAGSGLTPVATSVAYDMAVTSLFTPLIRGGTVELLETFTDDPRAGADLLSRARPPGMLKLSPSYLDMLLSGRAADEPVGWPETLVVGGERFSADVLEPWRDSGAPVEVYNEYGPTETVVGVCVHSCSLAGLPSPGEAVPIGRPIAGARVYVLDGRLEPVPQGAPGELYIGGPGVARGYLDKPGLTAARFVADPVSGTAGGILYRTGDLVRYRPDGTLDFLGRRDEQIKVRGFRLEPAEIETTLQRHPAVRQAAVGTGTVRAPQGLTAYLVHGGGAHRPSAAELRGFLRETLPEHAVPAAYVWLGAIPLTRNGKVDRTALAGARGTAAASSAPEPPRGRWEEALADVWRRVLERDDVGTEENFFDAGGNSLLAVRVHRELLASFGQLPLAAVFQHPTIRSLAGFLESGEGTGRASARGSERASARRAARGRRSRPTDPRTGADDDGS